MINKFTQSNYNAICDELAKADADLATTHLALVYDECLICFGDCIAILGISNACPR